MGREQGRERTIHCAGRKASGRTRGRTATEAQKEVAREKKDELDDALGDLNRSTNRLRRKFDPLDKWIETRPQVETVLDDARKINQVMVRGKYGTQAERYWGVLRTAVNDLARCYNLTPLGDEGFPSFATSCTGWSDVTETPGCQRRRPPLGSRLRGLHRSDDSCLSSTWCHCARCRSRVSAARPRRAPRNRGSPGSGSSSPSPRRPRGRAPAHRPAPRGPAPAGAVAVSAPRRSSRRRRTSASCRPPCGRRCRRGRRRRRRCRFARRRCCRRARCWLIAAPPSLALGHARRVAGDVVGVRARWWPTDRRAATPVVPQLPYTFEPCRVAPYVPVRGL